MTTSMNAIIVNGLMATETFKERLALLMSQSPNLADFIVRCADPVIKSIYVDPSLKEHFNDIFPFEISDVRCKVTEYGDIQMEVYLPKRYNYYVRYDDRYNNGVLSNPTLEHSLEKTEEFDHKMYLDGWCNVNYKPYESYLMIERV